MNATLINNKNKLISTIELGKKYSIITGIIIFFNKTIKMTKTKSKI